jgi:peptidoglycan hydrolase-like protein with peptidoglycan-binding domain
LCVEKARDHHPLGCAASPLALVTSETLIHHRVMNQGPTIQQGATGEDVKRLQRLFVMMKLLGFEEIDGVFGSKTGAAVTALQKGLTMLSGIPSPGAIDGDFGPQTKASVQGYQTLHGLIADGIVGDRTWWVPAGAPAPRSRRSVG